MRNLLLVIFAVACYTVADQAAEVCAPMFVAAPSHEDKGYTQQERDQMDALVGFVIPQTQEVVLFHRDKKAELVKRQAAVLAKVFGVTPENMNHDIFGRPQ